MICKTRECYKVAKIGYYCEDCFQKKVDKRINHKLAKLRNTVEHGLSKVKEVSDLMFWATSHKNCFRATFGKGESPEHMDMKYARWKYHRSKGRIVFCELKLKNGLGRPDLLIVDNGHVLIEEIPVSEKMPSLLKKIKKYPFPTNIVTKDKNGNWVVEDYNE